MSEPIEITGEEFDAEVVGTEGLVLVDFWGDGCAPCKAIAPVLKKLAAERADSLKVVKINFQNATQLAVDLGINALPTLLLYKDGEKIAETAGLKSKAVLEQWIDEA